MKYVKPSLPDGLPSWFGERDKDRDGQIGLYEWQQDISDYKRYDRNNDGFLTAAEVLRIENPTASRSVKTLAKAEDAGADSEKSSNVSKEEAKEAASALSSLGNIFSRSNNRGSSDKGSEERSNRRGRRGREGGGNRFDRMFAAGDKNSDGKISKKELEDPSMRWLNGPTAKDLDANNDGAISKDEFTKGLAERRRERGNFGGRRGGDGGFGFGSF